MAVWMDGTEARIFHVTSEGFDEMTLHSPSHRVHRHPKDQLTRTHNHPDDHQKFFRDVAAALGDAQQILIVGPAITKVQFLRYLHKNHVALEARVIGVETVDHPTDRQIVAYVRQHLLRWTEATQPSG